MDNANLYLAYARNFPPAVAEFLITEEGERYSYGDLTARSARLAHTLVRHGMVPGDRLTVQAEKCPEFIWLYLACLRAGIVFHPLNPAYTTAEVEYFVEDAAPAALLGDAASITSLSYLGARFAVPLVISLDELCVESAGESAEFATLICPPEALAALLYSSGTTGKPKGIMLSHHNLATNALALSEAWGFTRADALLHLLPLFHVHGLFIALGCTLMSGSRLVFHPRFNAQAALDALSQASVMMGVPTYYTRLLAEPGLNAERCQALRLFTCGSAPLLAETWQAFQTRTGHAVLERYGMTETSIITTNPLVGERRPGAVGPALHGVDVRVVDNADQPVPAGTAGHVQVRSPSVFVGYWRKPDKTREDFTADGFFRTGDDGVLDQSAYLWLVGRAKDLVITGGLNVYPSEVEQVLDAEPGVRESAVIGLPHPDFGEQVVAVLVLQPNAVWDEGRVRTRVREQLAAFKCPKHYRIVSELPRNAMGKVQKNLLRTQGLA